MSGLKTTKVVGRFLRIEAEFADGCDVAELSMLPGGRTIILGCVDPRVDPAAVLGLRLGEAVVIRNIGGRITQATIRTLALLAAIARSGGTQPGAGWELVVVRWMSVGHSRRVRCRRQVSGGWRDRDQPCSSSTQRKISAPSASRHPASWEPNADRD